MELNEITIEEINDDDREFDNVFVRIPFLYHPVMKELKKKEAHINKLYLSINRDKFETAEVLISLARLFGIPHNSANIDNIYHLNYADKTLEIEFSSKGLPFSGSCQLNESEMVFSENTPYIKVMVEGESETVIVLPEGSGEYYMNLDKRESESENRTSIIGNPRKLRKCSNWYNETFPG